MAAPMDIDWNPPGTFYLYSADLYCPPCAQHIQDALREQMDPDIQDAVNLDSALDSAPPLDWSSDHWPMECSDGETDAPDHCGHCHRFLGRTLTDDGVAYVKQAAMGDIDQYGAIGPVVQGWLDYYDLDLDGYYGADGVCLASAVGIECECEPEEV